MINPEQYEQQLKYMEDKYVRAACEIADYEQKTKALIEALQKSTDLLKGVCPDCDQIKENERLLK